MAVFLIEKTRLAMQAGLLFLLAEEWGFEPQLERGPTISFRN